MKTITTIILLSIAHFLTAQVSIPNVTFEYYLVNMYIDTDGVINGQISTADALAVTTLDINNLNLTDITGINGFQNMTTLYASGNNLNAVSLNLPNLEVLTLDNNNLSSIDLSTMPVLATVTVRNNTSLAAINPNLSFPYVDIRMSNCAFSGNINLSNLTDLQIADFSNNAITGIETTGLTDLDFLAVDNCGLANLDVSSNINLTNLTALNNDLTCIDLSNNASLTGVELNGNDPSLTIVVADVTSANAGAGNYQNWYKDASATYNTSCTTASINDNALELHFSIYPNPVKNTLTVQSATATSFTLFDLNGRILTNGIFKIGNNNINTNNLDSGIYFLKIKTANSFITKKIIKN